MASLPKVPSSNKSSLKASDFTAAAMTSFDRANSVLREIETFLETELEGMPHLSTSYDGFTRPKSKRKRGPFLIKDISKSKTRKTLNDMVYDPVLGVWVGNPEALKSFSHQPHLIQSKTRPDKSKALNGMTFDPVAGKWIGNEAEVRLFEKVKPGLIAGLTIPKVHKIGEMSFDPVNMKWHGGEDLLPDFGPSDNSPVKDDGFVVGTEFQLTSATSQLFAECAERHQTKTAGWWRDEKNREHLYVIRTMSVMRLVRDVRRSATSYYEEPSFMDIASEREVSLKSPREPETDFDDAWDELGDVDLEGAKLKLRDGDNSVDDIDAELDKLSKEDKEKKFASIGNRSGKLVVEEEWDEDFAPEDLKSLSVRLKQTNYKPIPSFTNDTASPNMSLSSISTPSPNITGTITNYSSKTGSLNKKPFELLKSDAPHRRSFHILPTVEKKPTKIAWEDDDEGGLEIPSGPLRLKASSDVPANEIIDDEDAQQAQDPEGFDEPEVIEVEEEDWDDVALPAEPLGEPVTKRAPAPKPQLPEMEKWDDFEIPAEKLELKVFSQNNSSRHHKSSRGRAGDDEDFDGLDIPEGVPLRLKR